MQIKEKVVISDDLCTMAASPESIELFKLNDLIAGRHIPASIAIPNGWFEPNDKSATKKAPFRGLISGWKTGEETEQKSAQIYYMFINHRSEILSMKEQVQLIRGVLAA